MKDTLQQLAEQIGTMLAESPMDPKLKRALVERLDKMPEDMVFKLKDLLEKEKNGMENLMGAMESFMTESDARWDQVVKDQQKAADEMTDELFEKLKDHPDFTPNGKPGDGTT